MVSGDWFDVPVIWFFLMNMIFLMNLCCTGASSNICTNLCVISPRACFFGQGRFTSHEDLEPENISSCFPTWQPDLTSQHTDLLAIRGPCCLWTNLLLRYAFCLWCIAGSILVLETLTRGWQHIGRLISFAHSYTQRGKLYWSHGLEELKQASEPQACVHHCIFSRQSPNFCGRLHFNFFPPCVVDW